MLATRLSDHVLVVTGDYLDEHMTVLATGRGAIVIDGLATMPATRAALPLVRGFSSEPVRFVVNTHLDADHHAGNHLFPDATIIAHANGRRRLDKRVFDDPSSKRDIRAFVGTLEAATGGDEVAVARRERYLAAFRTLLDGFEEFTFAPPSVFVAGGTSIVLEDFVLELHHGGPGHTDADLLVHVPEEGLLITGDLVMGRGYAPVVQAAHGGSLLGLGAALAAIERLATDDTCIVPGHGGIGGLDEVRLQRVYIETLLDEVRAARERGLTLAEARQVVHVEAFRHCLLYDLVHPDHVELAWRETGASAPAQEAGS